MKKKEVVEYIVGTVIFISMGVVLFAIYADACGHPIF